MVEDRNELAQQVPHPLRPAAARGDRPAGHLAPRLYVWAPAPTSSLGTPAWPVLIDGRRPRFTDKAAWVDNIDVADAAELVAVLVRAGFDGKAIVAAADSDKAKVRVPGARARAWPGPGEWAGRSRVWQLDVAAVAVARRKRSRPTRSAQPRPASAACRPTRSVHGRAPRATILHAWLTQGTRACVLAQVDDGEIVWGQDRLDVVSDILCGWSPDASASKL